MPNLTQERAPGQAMDPPLEHEVSSIPCTSDFSKWEHPSAQQFYNMLVREGWETPEDRVQTMVDPSHLASSKSQLPPPRHPLFKPTPNRFNRHDWIFYRPGQAKPDSKTAFKL